MSMMQGFPSEAASDGSVSKAGTPKNDMDLKEILFSPVKSVASWLNHHDPQMTSLEGDSLQSPGDLTWTTSEIEEDYGEDAVFPRTPRAYDSESPSSVSPPVQDQFDALREIVNFFSPKPKMEEAHSALRTASPDATRTPQEPPKRLDFDTIRGRSPATSTMPTPPREVATLHEIYADTRKGLARVARSAKEANVAAWWENARKVDPKIVAEKARTATQKTANKVRGQVAKLTEAAKEIKPKQVLEDAKRSGSEIAGAVRNNAGVHPLPWTIIGVVAVAAIVHCLFLSGSVGTPSMQYWQFSVRVHKPVLGVTESVIDRVSSYLQTQVGPGEADQIMGFVRSNRTTAASVHDVLFRLSNTLDEHIDNEPDIMDLVQSRIAMVRENPRHYYNLALSSTQGFLGGMWKRGRQLNSDAFDDVTAL